MFWTYILFSPSLNRYYIGQTGNIRARLRFHINGSTAYTQQAKDWMLVFLQQTSTRAAAMHLERKIKQAKCRQTIQRYIHNPGNQITRPANITDW